MTPPRSFLRPILLGALLAGLAPPLGASESPLSGAAFEAYVTGKTLSFASDGQPYGAEQYLPGRRVLWAFDEDICRDGIWFEEEGQICFVYAHAPDPQCWIFWLDGGLQARFMGEGVATELQEVSQSTAPLPCPGPDVGA